MITFEKITPRPLEINAICAEAHKTATEHGFWEDEPSFAESIALIHSELSEALEEDRKGSRILYEFNGKPEGMAVELADAVIRICDLCAHMGIDLDSIIRIKMQYNKNREYKHGRKY